MTTSLADGSARSDSLGLPGRGDKIASRWFWYGLASYTILAGVFVLTLVQQSTDESVLDALLHLLGIRSPSINLTVFFLVVGSLVLTIAGFVQVVRDCRHLAKEEEDVSWIDEHPSISNGLALVLAPAHKRVALLAAGQLKAPDDSRDIETLADDRVRRVMEATHPDHAIAISPEALRGVAEARTARLGNFPRYLSSLLLLMAVLGTFAGVKTALPSLMQAVTAAQNPAALARPLDLVSDAFGGNALALIGALALGIMSQGLAFGRRHLLERLELVSERVLYEKGQIGTGSPLTTATQALRQAAEQLADTTGMLGGIETGLNSLGEDFRSALSALEKQLLQIAAQQRQDLYDRTSQALDRLQNRVAELADITKANATVYEGLVGLVNARADESRDSIAELKRTNTTLSQGMDAVGRLGEKAQAAADLVGAQGESIRSSQDVLKSHVDNVSRSLSSTQDGITQLLSALELTAKRLEGIDDRAASTWKDSGELIARALANASTPARTSIGGGETVLLLRTIAERLQESRVKQYSLWRLSAAVAIGILVGAALLVLVRPGWF